MVGHYVPDIDPVPEGGFELKGGCTLIFDLDSLELRYAIARQLLDTDRLPGYHVVDQQRVLNQYQYQYSDSMIGFVPVLNEPFAFLHQ